MSKDNSGVKLDSILEQLGAFGRYNVITYSLLLFPIYLSGLYGSGFVFEAPDINYRCNISECEHISNTSQWLNNVIPETEKGPSKCERYQRITNVSSDGVCTEDNFDRSKKEYCSEFIYFEDSAVRDFNLGCQDWKRTLIGTVRNSGLFISLPLTGIISDKYGRKLALSVASLMNGIFGILRSFSPNYISLLVLEFCEAALGAGAYSTAFVLAMELVGPKMRVTGNTIINAVYVLGLMTLAGISWWLQSWRNLLLVIYTPAVIVFSYFWLLNESVRWLLSKGRQSEAVDILRKAAKMNKVEISEHLLAPLYEKQSLIASNDDSKEIDKILDGKSEKTPSVFIQVFKSSIIRRRVFICAFLWITCTFVYYGLSINSVSLAGNKYINFMLVGFVEIPANFACWLVLDRFGRKKTLITTYVLSACLCIGLSFVPKSLKWFSLVLYLLGKFSITVSYSSVYIYVSEVFPTSVRQSLLAVCSCIGRVGSALAPLTPLLALYYESLPAIFFGAMALIASLLVFGLPETINVPLPDTIEEAESLSKMKPQEKEQP